MVNNPDDMGIYNPRHRRVGRDRPRRRRAVLLRPRELQRRHGRGSARASWASTRACTCSTRPSACPRAAAGPRSAPSAAPTSSRRSCRARRRCRDGDALPRSTTRARQRRQGARVLGQRAAGREGLRLGARDGCRRDRGGRRPLRAREQLHGEAHARDPRRDALERAARRAADGDDALQPREAAARRPASGSWTSRTAWSTSASMRRG